VKQEAAPIILESYDDHHCGLRVEFHWAGDRYRHTIVAITGDQDHPLVESVEGEEGDSHPPSPCFMQLQRHAQTLLLTGATSVSHWSVSVETVFFGQHEGRGTSLPKRQQWELEWLPDSARHILSFDVACRLKQETSALGSTYNMLEAITSNGTLVQFSDTAKQSITGGLVVDPKLAAVSCQPSHTSSKTSLLEVSPLHTFPSQFPATLRWRYTFFLQ